MPEPKRTDQPPAPPPRYDPTKFRTVLDVFNAGDTVLHHFRTHHPEAFRSLQHMDAVVRLTGCGRR